MYCGRGCLGVGSGPLGSRAPLGEAYHEGGRRVPWGEHSWPTARPWGGWCGGAGARCPCLWLRVVRAWGPREGRCEGLLGLGAHPPRAARPCGRQPGSAAHSLWARVCGCEDPALVLWRACPAGCRALGGWREVAPGGGYLGRL